MPECLHHRFVTEARRRPDAVAVTSGEAHVTYGELDRWSDGIAGALGPLDRDTLVGLCAERGPGLIAGMLGILKAGGAYVPIDPAYPAERIEYLVKDSGVATVVCDAAGREHVSGAHVVDVDRPPSAQPSAQPPAGQPPAGGAADTIAYVIYTSGSTGNPKGVEVEHRNVTRLFDATDPWFGFGPDDVWTMFHSASFDFSVWEIWGALLYGGRLVIVPPDAARAPVELLRLLREERVTVLNQTPSAFRILVAADAMVPGDGPESLRYVVFGGERLDVGLLRPWIERHGDGSGPTGSGPALVNMYGITETTVHVTYRRIVAADLADPGSSPVGVPIPDLAVSLRDPDGAIVPDGTPGELWVGGAGVARGYHDRPELTAERFVTVDGSRAYRSGDLAVWRDAELVHLGRIDDQIKVRGFRIEPFEVEVVLTEHPDVAGVVVDGEDHGDGDVRLVAHVQLGEPAGARDPVETLRRHAAERLPAHLRPDDYRFVPRIPLTPQGKADRAALRDRRPTGQPEEKT